MPNSGVHVSNDGECGRGRGESGSSEGEGGGGGGHCQVGSSLKRRRRMILPRAWARVGMTLEMYHFEAWAEVR